MVGAVGERGLQVRVLLATDRPDLGDAICLYLTERQIEVVDVAADARGLLARAARARPDVVLVDWHLGAAASAQAVADFKGGADPTPVIILSTSQERTRAHALGAAAYATLGDPPDKLVAALEEVVRVTP